MNATLRNVRRLLAPIWLATSVACVEVQQVAPGADSLLPSVREIAATNLEAKPFTGLRLESRVAGSLIDLQFAPGLDVTEVVAGSPAEAAGIRVGDRITKANRTTIETVEQFDSILAANVESTLTLEVERDSGVVDVTLKPTRRGGAADWQPARFAERLKVRLVVATVPSGVGKFHCEIVSVLPGSPCLGTLKPGDVILEFNGSPATDARELVQRWAKLDFGEQFEVKTMSHPWVLRYEFTTYSPPRKLTALSIPILFTFARDLAKDETEFELIDLFVLKLYGFYREGPTRRHELLWFTVFETGVGEIAAEPTGAEEDS